MSPYCKLGSDSSISRAKHSLLDWFTSVTWISSTMLLLSLPHFHLSSDAWPCRSPTSTNFRHPARSYRCPSGSQGALLSHWSPHSQNHISSSFHWLSQQAHWPCWPTISANIYYQPLQWKTTTDIGKPITVWESSKDWVVEASDHHLTIWKRWWKLEGLSVPEIGFLALQIAFSDQVYSVGSAVK